MSGIAFCALTRLLVIHLHCADTESDDPHATMTNTPQRMTPHAHVRRLRRMACEASGAALGARGTLQIFMKQPLLAVAARADDGLETRHDDARWRVPS